MSKLAGLLFWILFPIVATAETVTITSPSPTSGQLITIGCIQVIAIANSDVGAKITGWRIYVDNVSTGFRAHNTARINTRVCVPSVSIGGHRVYVRAWSANGAFGTSTAVNVTISGEYKIVAPNDEALSPVTGQSFINGMIRVSTSVYSPYPLGAWIVYIDGQRAFTSYQSAIQVKTDLEVPEGTHNVVVKVWNYKGAIAQYRATNVRVTKERMNIPPFVTPPSTAITLRNLDDKGMLHWKPPLTGAAASCPGGDPVCDAIAAVAVMAPAQYVATPSPLPVASDGMGTLFETLPGTEPWANALYGTSNFDNDASRPNFVSDMWVLPTTTNIWTIELDLYATASGKTFVMGTQCNFGSGHWDFWDQTHSKWLHVSPTPENNDLVCNLKPNQWAHLRFHMAHDATSYHFVSLEIDGANHSLSELPASLGGSANWGDGTAFVVQLDSNPAAIPFGVYIDDWNLTKW